MSRGFHVRRGVPTAVLASFEAALLRDLLGQLLDILGPARVADADEDPLVALTGLTGPTGLAVGTEPGGGAVRPPQDPVLARLFPDANRDDPVAAAEFRRLTEGELCDGKRQAAHTVLTQVPARGGRVSLDAEQAEMWLGVLNDLRLALGTRLGVTQDTDLDDSTPADSVADVDPEVANRLMALDVYHWLGFLQSSLLTSMGS